MTQKTKILTLSLVSVAGLAAFTAFASNNISSLDFRGEVKQNTNLELKQLNLMPDITQKNSGGAAGISWKVEENKLVTTQGESKVTPNKILGEGTLSFGGQWNTTEASESLILAGRGNHLKANTSIVGASKEVVGQQGEGNSVLASSKVTFTGNNNIISSSDHTKVNGTGNIVISSYEVAINTSGAMAIGKKVRINHEGSFIFNGTDTEVASNKAYTTKIIADKGMLINTNSQKANGVDLTINGGLKVAHNTTDEVWAIISQEKCLKIKGVNKWEIWFWCSTTQETKITTPKCGKNAADYLATANKWKESSDRGFCENGILSPSTQPTFWTDAEKASAKSNGSYASAGFGKYSFTICFVEGDPFCKASATKKTWRCETNEGNSIICEATIAGSKTPVTEPKKCNTNEHLEGTTCVSNTKQVACDRTGINAANGSLSNDQVTITRSNGNWSAPEKCTLNCNTGYEKKESWCVWSHPVKIDRSWAPFNWEYSTVYDKNKNKVWTMSRLVQCSPDTRSFHGAYYANRLICSSYNLYNGDNWLWHGWWGNIKLLPFLLNNWTYYIAWFDGQRNKFDIEVINYVQQENNYTTPVSQNGSKIINIQRYGVGANVR